MKKYVVYFGIEMLGPCAISGCGNVHLWAHSEAAAIESVKHSVAHIKVYQVIQYD